MAQNHRLQQQRFELKYLVDESVTPWVRDFVSSYLELDDYGVGRPNLSYPIHSVYLDSADLKTYQSSVNGAKNRFKLRMRYYDDEPDTPVFFEIKARVDNSILKQRCGVRRDSVPLILAGHLPEQEHLFSTESRHLTTMYRFSELQQQLNARPKVHNTYLREAWVSREDNSVRVTMDRDMQSEPYFLSRATTQLTRPTRLFGNSVILELKFTTRFPNWFQQLVRRFNLMQFSAAKYVEGIVQTGESRFHDGEQDFTWQGVTPRAGERIQAS
jgi:VTC domain